MNTVQSIQEQEFFAPANTDAVDLLIGQYRKERENIETVAAFMVSAEMQEATHYFFEGNRKRFDRYVPDVGGIFSTGAALPALNSRYWSRALSLTDVRDYMPDKRRQEWDTSIRELQTPDFEETTVRATLGALLAQRMDFLAEMVDGIFQGLSGEHVTNRPEGFGKRMIIDLVFDSYGYSHGKKAGLIHDLRTVIAKFMGRDQPHYSATSDALKHCRHNVGQWCTWDGGALRVRVYLKGTAHMEIHQSISYRLNQILAHRYPNAITDQHRKRPNQKAEKQFTLMQRPIPFAVLKVLASGRFHRKGKVRFPAKYQEPAVLWEAHTLDIDYQSWQGADKHLKREIERVLEAIGGSRADDYGNFAFDYDAESVILEVIASGAIPDQKSHQFYPTPEKLARIAVELAGIESNHECGDLSAGQGGIADFMPKGRTTCVEVSSLNCAILRAKGFNVIEADFLEWAKMTTQRFDRIVINPPFSEGRALAHVTAAAGLLNPNGKLTAILPDSYRNKNMLSGLKITWSQTYENEFIGTSISVAIMTAERAQ